MSKITWSLQQVTPPATEPVTRDDLKAHLRLDVSDEDTLIDTYITSARQAVETWLNRALITQTWQLRFDVLPAWFELPKPPLQSVNAITITDLTGSTTPVDSNTYAVVTHGTQRGRVMLKPGDIWPVDTWDTLYADVQFTCGYGDGASNVPDAIKLAIKTVAGALFQQRENFVLTNALMTPAVSYRDTGALQFGGHGGIGRLSWQRWRGW